MGENYCLKITGLRRGGSRISRWGWGRHRPTRQPVAENVAVAKPLVTVTATITVRSANFRSASIP